MSATFPTQVDLLLIRNGAPVASATRRAGDWSKCVHLQRVTRERRVSSYEVRLQAADDTYPQTTWRMRRFP